MNLILLEQQKLIYAPAPPSRENANRMRLTAENHHTQSDEYMLYGIGAGNAAVRKKQSKKNVIK